MPGVFGSWIVAKKPANIDQQELTIWEHFEKIEADRSGIEVVLIREDGQNRIDRQIHASVPVRIRIFFSGPVNALPAPKAAQYFKGLGVHLEAAEVVTSAQDIFNAPCEFAVIECFGTCGLVGDETEHFRTEIDDENHFLSFFRAFGVSGNSRGGAKGGSWGVGKSVYFYSSRIRSIFGLSIREHQDVNRRRVLMGKSVMKFHRIGDKSYVNTGYLGQTQNSDELVLPFFDQEVLDEFSKDFALKRKDERGLSIVIPYCEATDPTEILHAIISEYGGSILSERLEVDLELPGLSAITINKETLFSILENQPDEEPWKETKALLMLLLDGESMPSAKVFVLPEVRGGTNIEDIELTDEVRDRMVIALGLGEAIRIEVPVLVTKTNGSTERSKFRVYMQQVEQRGGVYPVFFRDALRISGITTNRPINGVRSVFIADGPPGNRILTDLLRLAEGPSHAEWKSKQKVKDNYKHVPAWLKLCKNMPKRLVSLVQGSREELNNQSLADLFPDPIIQRQTSSSGSGNSNSTTGGVTGRKREGGGGGGGNPAPFKVTPLLEERGFAISITEGVETNKTFTVEMAYKRSRGTSSFKSWDELDFTTNQLFIACEGGTIKEKEGNRIVVAINDPKNLRLTVKGFDINRNPTVKVSEGELLI